MRKTSNGICFSELFFSGESTLYLYNPVGARWVKRKQNYILAQNKLKNIGHWMQSAQEENITDFVWTKYECPKLYKSIRIAYLRNKGAQRYFKRFLIS